MSQIARVAQVLALTALDVCNLPATWWRPAAGGRGRFLIMNYQQYLWGRDPAEEDTA